MVKTSIIIYTLVAFFILYLIAHHSDHRYNHHHRQHRRLKLRSSFPLSVSSDHHSPAPFDPIVADIERRREDKHWDMFHGDSAPAAESQPEWEDFMDAEDYLNDEDRFNVTNRLVLLFPKLDVSPVDGLVTTDELTEWNLKQSERETMHRTTREMELHDKNRDGLVSFAEYEPPSWVKHSDNSSFGYDMGWWKEEHFKAADADGDGLLDITEYNDFMHPADSNNSKLLLWLCREEIRERDKDKDEKVNFKEFFNGLFDMIRDYDEEAHNSSQQSDPMEAPAKTLFAQLDKDGDGYLSEMELLPIIGKLHPSERYYAKHQADYLISQADTNKDGSLSLTEMIENPYVFYTAIFKDDEDDYEYHDEFR